MFSLFFFTSFDAPVPILTHLGASYGSPEAFFINRVNWGYIAHGVCIVHIAFGAKI